MSTTAFGTDDRAVVSVRDLVHRRLGIDGDPWNLALVQRAEVWRAPRMLRLLDSLIAGYPIGALLICRVTAQSKVIARVDGVRRVTDADKAAWQLLDGQQRINALYSIFTQHGQYGRFFVHMTTPRETPDPSNRSRKSNDLPAYLAWRDVPERDESEPLEERHLHIDLSNWFDWALANDGRLRDVSRGLSEDPSSVVATMREIDGEFAETLTDAQSQHAAGRLRRLISVWNEPSVPILRTEVGDPLDVLEVFTRINIGGVQIIGSDVYFAAVKTFWPDASRASID